MNFVRSTLPPGLYLVSTPLGNARDITLRALDVLASADLLVAEDTRTLRKLMDIHGIPLEGRRVVAYHDHSGEKERARILRALSDGRSVAYASEAGTPLIADPGFALAAQAQAQLSLVTAAPGPCAAITALTLASMPTDRFMFLGFAPSSQAARRAAFAAAKDVEAALIYYEAPRRLGRFLADAEAVFGSERRAALCRELTKRFEEVRTRSLGTLAEEVKAKGVKGECVLILDKPPRIEAAADTLDEELKTALTNLRLKDAVDAVAGSLGLPRRAVYKRALALKSNESKLPKSED